MSQGWIFLQFFFQLLSHIFKTLPLFFKTLHTNPGITFTFIHLADAFIQSNLQLGNTSSDSS